MGCASSLVLAGKFAKRTDERTAAGMTIHGFTDREKHIIKKTWKIVSNNMPGVGANIFLAIFSLNPEVKQIFPCRDATGDALLRDPNFRGHASRFMQAVGAAVDNIHDLDEAMGPLLLNLGQQHIHYAGFKLEYFDIFIQAILKVFESELGSRYTAEVRQAWRKVVEFMISQMKEGYIKASSGKDSLMQTGTGLN